KILHLSQPAVSKTIKNLEIHYGRAFFERSANSIKLTEDGHLFLAYCEKIIRLYEQVEDEFIEDGLFSDHIKLGASTTLANYILPKLIAGVQKAYPQLKVDLKIGNTLEIQEAVLKKEINLGVVEGDNHNTRLQYRKFVRDELVLASRFDAEELATISQKELERLPLIGREIGSGTREVIENHLNKEGIEIRGYHAEFGSTESIKTYLLNSSAYAFLSIHAIEQELKTRRLGIIDVEKLNMPRWFYFTTRQGFHSKS